MDTIVDVLKGKSNRLEDLRTHCNKEVMHIITRLHLSSRYKAQWKKTVDNG